MSPLLLIPVVLVLFAVSSKSSAASQGPTCQLDPNLPAPVVAQVNALLRGGPNVTPQVLITASQEAASAGYTLTAACLAQAAQERARVRGMPRPAGAPVKGKPLIPRHPSGRSSGPSPLIPRTHPAGAIAASVAAHH